LDEYQSDYIVLGFKADARYPFGLGRLAIVVAVLSMVGCATQVSKEAAQPQATIPQQTDSTSEAVNDQPTALELLKQTDPEIIYLVGSAEILGQKRNFAEAAQFYAKAAQLSDDPAIAARAVEVAAFAENEVLIAVMVARWLSLDPNDPGAHRYGLILALRQSAAAASWQHTQGLLRNSRDPDIWTKLIGILSGAKDRQLAGAIVGRLYEQQLIPNSEPILAGFSDLAVQLNRLVLAEQLANNVIELNSTSAVAYAWRARIRTTLGKLEEAKSDFAQAVEIDPQDQAARQSYATLLAETGDYPAALRELEQVDPDLRVLYQRSLYAHSSDQTELALEIFEQLRAFEAEDEDEKYYFLGQLAENLELAPSDVVEIYNLVRSGERLPNARLRMAIIMAEDDKLPQARAILRRLRNGNEEIAANAYLTEASLLRRLQGDLQAMEVYDEAVQMLPNNRSLLFARSLHAEVIDRIDIAEADLRKVLEMFPNDPSALNALGYTLADRTERYDEALVLLEKAYGLQPNQAAIVDSLGWVHFKLGNLDQSIQFLRQALDLQYDSEIAAHLGEALWASGETDEAHEIWNEALEKDPESEILTETSTRLQAGQ